MITKQMNIKYIDWLMQWIENYIRPSVKMRTYERYKLIVEQHIKDKIGGMDMNDLSPFVLQQFITELLQSGNKKTGKGLSANSVNAVISVLQSSLRTALLLGLTKEYTADKLKRPKLQEKSVECFTIAEQKQIEKAVMNGKKDKLYGILLCLYSGLRIGELIALQWSDIDLTKGILTVSKSCHDSKDGLIIDAPKTISSRRAIPLPKQLLPRTELWNAVEAAEKAKDSRLARELIVALPVEIGLDEWKAILKDFISKQCVNKGMCADCHIFLWILNY